MSSSSNNRPQGNDEARPQANPDPKGKGKEIERPQANPDPKGKGKERERPQANPLATGRGDDTERRRPNRFATGASRVRDWAEEVGESSRHNEEQALARRPGHSIDHSYWNPENPMGYGTNAGYGIDHSSWNPRNPKGYGADAGHKKDKSVASKKRKATEMAPGDPGPHKEMKYQEYTTATIQRDHNRLPSAIVPRNNIWGGTNVVVPSPFGDLGCFSQSKPSTAEGRRLQEIMTTDMAEKSPTGEIIQYIGPVLAKTRRKGLKGLIEDEGPSMRPDNAPLKKKSSGKAAAPTQHVAQPPSRFGPQFGPQVSQAQRASSCAACGSRRHGTGNCPGGYDMRHGDVPICPYCHTTSARQMRGHTFDTLDTYGDWYGSERDLGCRHIREAGNYYDRDLSARGFLTLHLLVGRKGKAPVRAYREEHCFIAYALELSHRWSDGEMPGDIGSVWPLTKEDAVRHSAALRNWDNLAPEDRPRSSLDSLSIDEIREQYEAGIIPPQVFDAREDIQTKLRRRDQRRRTQEARQPSATAAAASETEPVDEATEPADMPMPSPPKEPATNEESINEILQHHQQGSTDPKEDDAKSVATSFDLDADRHSATPEADDRIDFSDEEEDVLAKRAAKSTKGDGDDDDADGFVKFSKDLSQDGASGEAMNVD